MLVDVEGHLVEDPVSQRVVLHHMKENAVCYARHMLNLDNCGVATLAEDSWLDFCRETMYEWKDDKEEEDPLMVAFMRQQQVLKTRDAHSSPESTDVQLKERVELEQSILDVTDEIARLHQQCIDVEQHLAHVEADNAHLGNLLVKGGPLKP